MTAQIAIAITLLTAWVVAVWVGTGRLPASISQSVFDLPPVGRVLWTVVIGAVAFLTVPSLIDKCSEQTRFLAFIACAGLVFVAAAPLVQDKNDIAYKVHMTGAWTCAIASQLILVFNQPCILFGWVPWLIAFVWITKDERWRTRTLWAEMTCFWLIFTFAL